MENFVTVAVFNYQHETLIIKNLLEQEGIACFFENETIVGINPFGSIAYVLQLPEGRAFYHKN